jgi:hypothetical protein
MWNADREYMILRTMQKGTSVQSISKCGSYFYLSSFRTKDLAILQCEIYPYIVYYKPKSAYKKRRTKGN